MRQKRGDEGPPIGEVATEVWAQAASEMVVWQ
jgi:hypothetical protein